MQKVNVLEWPNQSLDLNPTATLRRDTKQADHVSKPKGVQELKLFCTEEWAKKFHQAEADVRDW